MPLVPVEDVYVGVISGSLFVDATRPQTFGGACSIRGAATRTRAALPVYFPD